MAEVQVALDRVQRHVDDGRVQKAHQLPEADDDKGDPARAVGTAVGVHGA
ncbi:MAG: hypothetical protein JO039_06595 [Solirubrobacterales bacterium]|nr:hypothetical protein [Solirubrobacterales bacterium]